MTSPGFGASTRVQKATCSPTEKRSSRSTSAWSTIRVPKAASDTEIARGRSASFGGDRLFAGLDGTSGLRMLSDRGRRSRGRRGLATDPNRREERRAADEREEHGGERPPGLPGLALDEARKLTNCLLAGLRRSEAFLALRRAEGLEHGRSVEAEKLGVGTKVAPSKGTARKRLDCPVLEGLEVALRHTRRARGGIERDAALGPSAPQRFPEDSTFSQTAAPRRRCGRRASFPNSGSYIITPVGGTMVG